jgi:hypothetical protein
MTANKEWNLRSIVLKAWEAMLMGIQSSTATKRVLKARMVKVAKKKLVTKRKMMKGKQMRYENYSRERTALSNIM